MLPTKTKNPSDSVLTYYFVVLLFVGSLVFALNTTLNAQWESFTNPGVQSGLGQNWTYDNGVLYNYSSTAGYRKSTDKGLSYQTYETPTNAYGNVVHNGQLFVWDTQRKLYRENGLAFEEIASLSQAPYFGVSFGNELFIMVHDAPIVSSDNGASFSAVAELAGFSFQGYGFIDNVLYVTAVNNQNGNIQMKKYDGSTWENVSNGPFGSSLYIAKLVGFDNRLFIETTNDQFYESNDGENWTQLTSDIFPSNRPTLLKHAEVLLIYNQDKTVYMAPGMTEFKEFAYNNGITRYYGGSYGIGDTFYTFFQGNLYKYLYQTESWELLLEAPLMGGVIMADEQYIYTIKQNFANLYRSPKSSSLQWEEISDLGSPASDLIRLQSGRVIAVQNFQYSYSDDLVNWTTVGGIPQSTWLSRGDSLFRNDGNRLYLSTDGAESWNQVASVQGRVLQFYGTDALLAGRRIYSLADFSQRQSFFTNFGDVMDYDTLGGYHYFSTQRGLYQKPLDESAGNTSGWTQLNSRMGLPALNQINEVFSYEGVLIVITQNKELFYSSDDGTTFSGLTPRVYSSDLYRVANMMYSVSMDGFHQLDLTQFGASPRVATLDNAEIIRRDTTVNAQVSAQIEPNGQAVEVWFEYGRFTGNPAVELTERTESQFFEAQDSSFVVTTVLDSLEGLSVNTYSYRALIRYGAENTERFGETYTFVSPLAQYWERLDAEVGEASYRDVLITRRGSIIAYSGGGYSVRSLDNGQTWEELNPPVSIYSLIQAAGDTLFAGSNAGQFMYSVNEGSSWTVSVSDSLPSTGAGNRRVPQLAYDSLTHSYYAIYGERERATNNATYLVKSSNAGAWWTTLATNQVPEGRVLNYLSVDLNGTIWIGTGAALQGENYLVKSTDGGLNWQGVLQSPSNVSWEGFELISISKDTLFFASETGPWVSFDAGVSWDSAAVGSENDRRRFGGGLGNRLAFSRNWGVIGVSHGFSTGAEQGAVNFTKGPFYAMEDFLPRFTRFAQPYTPNYVAPGVVLRVRVSSTDMIIAATNKGLYRFIPSAIELATNPDPDEIVVSVEEDLQIPEKSMLLPNYPNPFNPTTTIRFNLAEAQTVQLEIFNLMGQKVAALLQARPMAAGAHHVSFNASSLPSGVYIYRLQAGNTQFTGKMTLLK